MFAVMAFTFFVSRSRYGDLPVINSINSSVLGIQAFGVYSMLLAKLERELLKRKPVFRRFVLTSSLTNAVMLAGIYMLTRLPAPMTVPLYAAASIAVIAVFAWFQTELPILRKLQSRA